MALGSQLNLHRKFDTITPVTRRWKIFLAGLIAFIFLVPIGLHYLAKWKLWSYRNELRRQGAKLEVAELIPLSVSNGFDNSAQLLRASTAMGDKLRELMPGTMRVMAVGKARVAWKEAEIIQEVNAKIVPEVGQVSETNIWPLMEAEVATHSGDIKTMRELVARPLQFQITYQNGMHALLYHLAPLKQVSMNLAGAAEVHLHTKQWDEAQQDLLAQVRLLTSWEHEPILISQLVRCADAAIAGASAWEALQGAEFNDAQLAQLQSAWEQVDLLPEMMNAMQFEAATVEQTTDETRKDINTWRAMVSGTSGAVSRSDEFGQLVGEVLSNPSDGLHNMLNRYPRYWAWCWIGSYYDEMRELHSTHEAVEQLRAAHDGKPKPHVREIKDDIFPLGVDPANPWTFDTTLALQRSVARLIRQQTQSSMLIAAMALERYRLQHNVYPHKLEDLTPAFLKSVPMDFQDGKSLRYRLNADGTFVLYSVGDDGVDDGGDPTPTTLDPPKLYNGKDFVWLKPASAEEIKAFEAKEKAKNRR